MCTIQFVAVPTVTVREKTALCEPLLVKTLMADGEEAAQTSSRLQKFMQQEEAPASARRLATEAPSKRELTLRKRLRDILELERRQSEDGAILKANQKEKIAEKEVIIAELATLAPDVGHETVCRPGCCKG